MEFLSSSSQNSYMCRACGKLLIPSKYDLCAEYGTEIHQYLLDNYKRNGLYECRKDTRMILEIPLTVQCINSECDSAVNVVANVEANLVTYGNDLNNDKDTEIDCFDVIDASVMEFCQNQEIGYVQLRIVCKTDVNGTAKCYLGYDEVTRRLLRPVRSVYEFSWPNSLLEFQVGEIYKFKVLAFKEGPVKCLTDIPHQNEDMVVDETKITAKRNSNNWDPSELEDVASSNIFEIFPREHLKELKYVETNSDCPSTGVLEVSESDVKIHEYYEKKRVKIWNSGLVFDFPLTAVSYDRPVSERSRQAIVLLGLGRPYTGEMDNFNPARCYVLVLAIYLY